MLDRPTPSPARQHSELDIAKAHRGALLGRFARLQAERARLTEAEGAERQARADLDALGREEVAAVKAWAAEASTDPAPKADAERRHSLTIALAAREAESAAARQAGSDLDREMGAVQRDLADVAVTIDAAVMSEALGVFQDGWIAAQDRALALGREVADLFGILGALRNRAQSLQRQGHIVAASEIFRRLEKLTGSLHINAEPSPRDTDAATAAWQTRLAEAAR